MTERYKPAEASASPPPPRSGESVSDEEAWSEPDERAAYDRLLEAIGNAYDANCDTENVEVEVAVAALKLRDVARRFASRRSEPAPMWRSFANDLFRYVVIALGFTRHHADCAGRFGASKCACGYTQMREDYDSLFQRHQALQWPAAPASVTTPCYCQSDEPSGWNNQCPRHGASRPASVTTDARLWRAIEDAAGYLEREAERQDSEVERGGMLVHAERLRAVQPDPPGTYACPRCGKDTPHTHGRDAGTETAGQGPFSEGGGDPTKIIDSQAPSYDPTRILG